MAVSIGGITAANFTFTMTAAGLFTSPQTIQQCDVDDALDVDPIENGEFVKGVDNFLAMGWKPSMPKLSVHLMANSPSNSFYDTVFAYEQTNKTKVLLQGILSLPAVGTQWTLVNAGLFSYMPLPPVKQTLKGRTHILIMDQLPYAPIGFG